MRIVKYSSIMTVILALTRKRSKLWNYFEKLNHSLVKCTTCKEEIKTPNPTRRTKIMKAHILNVHGISLDDETVTLPDDLKQYYSELTGYKAKCNNCGKAVSFLTNIENLRVHLRRHSILPTRIQSRNETTPTKKRNKLWNYFEELNPSLVKCTTCKKEIKVSHPTNCTRIFRVHLLNVHGIFLDNDIYTLPDDLRQCYSEIPGYKAKCNNCGETVSFLKDVGSLRRHLRKHSTRSQSQDETTPTKKRNKLWNYFEELNPLLVKCTTCKKEIKISRPSNRITIFRVHLKRHGIFLDNDIRTLPDDLRQCYSELPGYKAKCNNCGKTLSFLTDIGSLRRHLRKHSTRIQSQDETTPTKKRNKLWNYFEELNPSLVKCTTCKKEIKVSHPTNCTRIFRAHLFKKHGISLDNDIRTLPDDLRQYYSELPGYKAKCNNCDVTLSFLRDVGSLRNHLRRHSTRIQSQDKTKPTKKRSKLWNYFEELNPSLVKCTTCKKEVKISCPSNHTPIFRAHLKRHGIFIDNDTVTLPDDLRQCYSKLPGYKAKCNNCGETISFLKTVGHLRTHLRRHSTITQSRDKTVMVPRKTRSKFWNYFEKLKPSLVKCTICKKEIKVSHLTDYTRIFRAHLFKKHGLSLDDDTLTLPNDLKQCFSELPGYKAKCNNCGKAVSFLSSIDNLRKHLRRHSKRIQSRDETVITAPRRKYSKLWNYFKELNSSLIKCTTCKKKIKVSHPENCITIMRVHLSRHGIFIHNDTHTLSDDLKHYYSELPKYKAKCNNCGEAVSFLTSMRNLREHLRRRHFTTIQSRYKTAQTKKRSKFWNYFEELKPSLVKCTTCKKKIKIPYPKSRTTIFRAHLLNVHRISLDNKICTLPDDLRQYYSELSGYKAKCNNCGKVVSFFTNIENLRDHLRRHSTRIQSRNETVMVPRKKRSKLWTYFEKLKPSLVKCVICKIKIYMPHPSNSSAITMGHLNKHGIFFNNDTFVLPDDLRQHYSELPKYKAKCNDCGKKMSLLKNIVRLRKHLRRHSTRILSRDEPSTSSLADDNVGPSARCQSQDDTSGLRVQSFIKERTEKTGALNEPGTLISTDYNTNSTAECESQETVDLDPQTCEQSKKDTRACDGPSTSSLADNSIDPSAGRQSQDTSDLPIQSLKEAIEKTGALDKPSTLSSTAYIIMDLSTEEYIPLRQSQEQVPSGLPVQSFKKTAENTGVLDEPSTSSSVDCVMDPSAEHQSGEQPGLPVQSFEQMTGETSALHSCIDVIIQFNKYPTS